MRGKSKLISTYNLGGTAEACAEPVEANSFVPEWMKDFLFYTIRHCGLWEAIPNMARRLLLEDSQ
jgi:hypothetical protein